MKTHRNEEYGFEIDIPDDWSLYEDTPPFLWTILFRLVRGWKPKVNVAFTCGPDEILNIVIEPMLPEPPPHVTQRTFMLQARHMGYTNCEFGRITVEDREHAWVRYQIAGKIWSKKYMVVLGGKGYAITASCKDLSKFSQREGVWDAIVASFRLLAPVHDSA